MPVSKNKRNRTKRTQNKNNSMKGWDLLNTTHDGVFHLLNTPRMLQPLLEDKRIDEKFQGEEREHLVQDLQIIGRDAQLIAQRLNEVGQRHADKKGEVKTPDEIMDVIVIDTEYKSIYSEMEVVYSPTVLSLSARLEKKRDEVIKEQKELLDKLANESA
ncbi:MAG: hypothetical protein M0R77_00990 [Gammaproteobacteria bacterium]|nr:hypothetical protein [Acholeplasmataceae bacterium]MCK9529131.1 hypothetical protein [Gammaproteobacteria bacterium]